LSFDPAIGPAENANVHPLRACEVRTPSPRWQPSVALPLALVLALALPTAAVPVEVHFSPDGGIRRHLLHAIQESRQRIDVAVYHMTAAELAAALVAAKNRGVQIRVLTDQEKARAEMPAMRILRRGGVTIRTLGVSEQSLMHHKFAVFDDRLVATGSYNWTNSAERANYENVVMLDDPGVVARFQREFNRLWQAAKD
jgi:mitochondrial cardiolipin hydrolase